MGKASRRRATRHTEGREAVAAPAPFVRRPFEGLPGETEWVALRDIVPAATATIRFAAGAAPEQAPAAATVTTVLPMAWPALHRNDGEVLVATQAGPSSGDPSRDIAASWLAAATVPAGVPVTQVPMPDASSPRLQALLDPAVDFVLDVRDDFSFWVGDAELDEDGQASLEHANSSIVPTRRIVGQPSVYWVDFGERRTFVRWILPDDEESATDGMARLLAADRARLTPDSRLLGAFRSCGLLVPVWEVDPDADAPSFTDPVAALADALREAIASTVPLTADERRARNGLLSRQVTLR